MKSIEQLSEAEILSLNDDGVELYVKYARAEAGIKFLECPVVPALRAIPKPTLAVYTTSLFYDSQLACTNKEELETLLDCIVNMKSRIVIGSKTINNVYYTYIRKFIDGENKVDVVKRDVYDEGVIEIIQDDLRYNAEVIKDYEARLLAYKDNEALAADIIKSIWDIVSNVRSKYAKLNQYLREFHTIYLPLAKANHEIALNFIIKAYNLSKEEQHYILNTSYAQEDLNL